MKFTGSCQCRQVTFNVDMEIDKVISCNCSRCRRLGSLLAAAPKAKFTLTSGKEVLTEFQFNKHLIHHYFCSICGIQPYAEGKGRDGSDMVMVNVRCLDGVDPAKFEVMTFDGASM